MLPKSFIIDKENFCQRAVLFSAFNSTIPQFHNSDHFCSQLIGGVVAYRYRNMLDPFGSAPAGAPFAGSMWSTVNYVQLANCVFSYIYLSNRWCHPQNSFATSLQNWWLFISAVELYLQFCTFSTRLLSVTMATHNLLIQSLLFCVKGNIPWTCIYGISDTLFSGCE